jgi:mycoredoxin
MNMKLIIYTGSWCGDCHVAKQWLAQNNIAFEEINIDETPGAAEEVIRKTGRRAIPQFVINDQWIQPYIPGAGFKYEEMAELFGISLP